MSLAFCPLAAPTLAQSWSGSASLGVQVRGSGGPVEGALVEIRHRRPRSTSGPDARRTDAKGQANFVGVIQGVWSLEIKHPDYLSFVASVRLEAGRKPEILTQFLEASGPGRNTFKVKFVRSNQSLGAVVPGTATEEITAPPSAVRQRPAAAVPAPTTPPREPAPSRPDPRPRKAEPAPQPEPSEGLTPEPAADPAPAPEPKMPEPTAAPVVAAAAEPETASRPPAGAPPSEPPAAAAPPPASQQPPLPDPPASEPVPESPESPATPPAPAAEEPLAPASIAEVLASQDAAEDSGATPTSESRRSSVTAFRDRTCFDCKPGEWAVTARIEVPTGEPCRPPTEVGVRRAMRDIAAVSSAPLAGFAGPLPADFDEPPLSLASGPARGTLERYLSASESCRLVAIVIPAGGNFTGFRLEAHDQRASGDCNGEQECEIGEARFLFRPAVARGSGASIVYSVFENTGPEAREAELTGFFLPPAGWSLD